jgi:hypothetical protein
MIRVQQHTAPAQVMFSSVRKAMGTRGQIARAKHRSMCDGAQREDNAHLGALRKFRTQELIACLDFRGQRFVRRGHALHRVRDAGVQEPEAVVRGRRNWAAGEAKFVQCPVEQDPRMIAGKWPARAIGAMQPRRESDDKQTGIGVAEGRYGATVVTRLLEAHSIEKRAQADAAPAHWIKAAVHERGVEQFSLGTQKTGYAETSA